MGYSDLPAYGSTNVSTPHLSALIASGMRFTQWISAAPICTPSRAALQTGRYPIRTGRSASALVVGSSAQTVSKSHQKLLLASGCIGNVEQYRVIPTPANPHGLDPRTETSIATALRRANYATGMSGKW